MGSGSRTSRKLPFQEDRRKRSSLKGKKRRVGDKGYIIPPKSPVYPNMENAQNIPSHEREPIYRETPNDRIGDKVSGPEITFITALKEFQAKMDIMLTGTALAKGYNLRDMDKFMSDNFGDNHALGEIIYKAIRFKRKKDVDDLVKIASWAFLICDRGVRGK